MPTERARRFPLRSAALAALAVASAACSPTFDWREARPDGGGIVVLFPCRPHGQERKVAVAGALVPMRLDACNAGSADFALTTVRVDDPARVTPVLAALREQMVANVAGTISDERALRLAGATPNSENKRVHVVGRRPDGSPVVADAAFFVKGLSLYQATVLGSDRAPGSEAVETFFGAIRLP